MRGHELPNEEPDVDFEYRPVTGIFVHASDDVWKVRFDNNDSLGVTANHPIYSTTYHDWRFAGELEVGEKVLTFENETFVTSKEKQGGEYEVFNLEVRGLHNFLVGRDGVVVHNNYFPSANE